MSFRANRRLTLWIGDLNRWAMRQQRKKGASSDEGQYALGIQLAVHVARGREDSFELHIEQRSDQTRQGFADARVLISVAMADGDAPKRRDFETLLADARNKRFG